MKAPINPFLNEHEYCDEWCARKYDLNYTTHQSTETTTKNKTPGHENNTGINNKTRSCNM